MNVEFRQILYGSPEYQFELDLRERILRKPLALTLSAQDLEKDAKDFHLGAFVEGRLVGGLILQKQGLSLVKMRQVAVETQNQGQGIGRKLVQEAERICQQKGVAEIILNARSSVLGFYESLNYIKEGEAFNEVGLPHVKMRKTFIETKHL